MYKDFNIPEYKENYFFDPKSLVGFYGDTLLNKVSVFFFYGDTLLRRKPTKWDPIQGKNTKKEFKGNTYPAWPEGLFVN